ncbi:ATP-dependent exonuclase V beta subunit, helicase and exonuclease domain-containing [Bernardetia litoralis DSM 6794]|uniref:DNA 3'-5' helicase n=1 Tax=Bernardetia litoralis (strain ATCC 23117 / DSM 6794 / NBRC 15988 / NCIMB 1366 / Fx l1 / Sio-4) TaxID=880071 RepID=I4AHD5_BERLS|nr:UvrD-helicase domain-containing protein [Bernardetia litoralis]AFM03370.1 ATP-dependent exonuclase V beta subunit, helicase and exonuclease domain-containing [Bernardetia litoralis DSM 6794]
MLFSIYRSSAGSGKTYTLTKEYIKIALASPNPELLGEFDVHYYRHILAVTFTNDAAKEMKQRIVSKLDAFSVLETAEEDSMFHDVLKELKEEYPQIEITKEEIVKRSKALHQTILHHYSDFAVSTIDSFSKRIVQAFTKDLDLPPNFEIQMDIEEALEEAVSRMYHKIGERGDNHLSEVMKEFVLKETQDEKSWNVDRGLLDFGKIIFEEAKKHSVDKIKALTQTQLKMVKADYLTYIGKVENEIIPQAGDFGRILLNAFEENGLVAKDFHYSSRGIYNYVLIYATNEDKVKDDWDKQKPLNSYIANDGLKLNKWAAKATKGSSLEAIKELSPMIKEMVLKIETLKTEFQEKYAYSRMMRRFIFQMMFLEEIGNQIEYLKEKKNHVYLSEFNEKINKIVENEPVPYIFERIGEKFKHILIDEFQDTSKMQWHNLIPLVSNSLANGMRSMVVGDAKQAIYRWRSGDADLLVNLPNVPSADPDSMLAEHTEIFKEHANQQILGTNRRSDPNIVDFNNKLFHFVRKRFDSVCPDLASHYAEVIQETVFETGGHVSVRFVEKDKNTSQKEYQERTFTYCLDLVKKLQKQDYKLEDITILVRTNGMGAFLAEKFIEQKIPVISGDSLLLVSSKVVQTIINFMFLLQQPDDAPRKLEIIEFLENHLEQKYQSENPPFDLAGELNNEDEENFTKIIKEQFKKTLSMPVLRHLSLYEIAEELIRELELYRHHTEQLYIQKLLDVLFEFSRNKNDNLLDFLEHWERKKGRISISSPEGGAALRVMTIHKSKGLEFPVVIMPFADWKVTPRGSSQLWVEWEDNPIAPELSTMILSMRETMKDGIFSENYKQEWSLNFIDAINNLYVGLTRPTEKLFIMTKEVSKLENKKPVKKKANNTTKEDNFGIDKVKDIADLLGLFLLREAEHIHKIEAREYVLSEDDSNKKHKTKMNDKQSLNIKELVSTEARNKIRVRKNNLRYDESYLTVEDFYDSRKDGLLMHYAFEKIFTINDTSKAVQTLINEGLIAEDERESLENKMKDVMRLQQIEEFFRPDIDISQKENANNPNAYKILNEQEIIQKGNRRVLRPDRMMIKGDTAILIDYKTGQIDPKHHQQINGYATALYQMGKRKVRRFLVYTEKMKIIEVD